MFKHNNMHLHMYNVHPSIPKYEIIEKEEGYKDDKSHTVYIKPFTKHQQYQLNGDYILKVPYLIQCIINYMPSACNEESILLYYQFRCIFCQKSFTLGEINFKISKNKQFLERFISLNQIFLIF